MTAIRRAASAAVPSEMSNESSHPFATARLITQGLRLWLEKRSRPEQIEDALRSGAAPLPSSVRSVLLTAVREHGRIDFLLRPRFRKPPPIEVRAALHAALAEILLRSESSPAPMVHYWVDWVRRTRSRPESRFANAVLRGCLRDLPGISTTAAWLIQSHPDTWVRHWRGRMPEADLETLLDWNQRMPPVFLRWLDTAVPPPEELIPTPFTGYFQCPPTHLDQLSDWYRTGQAIVQDPGQRHPVDIALAERPAAILDACAAPGGKSLALAALLDPTRAIVANEPPGARQAKLARDLRDLALPNVATASHDFTEPPPGSFLRRFDLVLADVPCSNTGVFRRNPDAKWRHSPDDLGRWADFQLALLRNIAPCVRPGGRLVYSTCSLEREENEGVVERFIAGESGAGFDLETVRHSLPWVDQTDGGHAFSLRRPS